MTPRAAALLLPVALAAAILLPRAPVAARDASPPGALAARLAEAVPGARFGIVVADDQGREIVALNPDQRFIPASNTKIFTTAAAFAALPGLDAPDVAGGAAVRIEKGNVVLEGNGDARLSSAADCLRDCLAALADAVAARTRAVRDIVGDDSLFPDERWSAGMSWNNILAESGTGISALTLDDNVLVAEVAPGGVGAPPRVAVDPYYAIDNRAVTVPAGGATRLSYDRLPLERAVRVLGTIAADAAPQRLRFGIDDPARYAAWRLKALLAARGVRVTGAVRARHRAPALADDPARRGAAAPARPVRVVPLARLVAPPLVEDLKRTNKVSQNLHAELLLRRVGLVGGTGSVADGLAAVKAMTEQAGVPRAAWDLSDGSGMSTYNRVSPRGMVRLLRWIAAQPWGAAWRDTLPIGGVDGTLARRFAGTPLEGRIFAKTGTLNASHALSGYMVARSGRTLAFAVFANDVPGDAAAVPAIDAALVSIAAAN